MRAARGKWMRLALAGAVVGALALAGPRLYRGWAVAGDGRTVVRIAHMHLSTDLKAAYARAIADYERINPDVRVEQIPIPYRLYPVWVRSQLTGGTAPDLLVIAPSVSADDLATHFESLSADVSRPNPYNAGTPLAAVPWRDTFLDGLRSNENYHPFLLENFAVPLMSVTIRLYYNPGLLRELTGLDEPPRDYEAFLEVCRTIRTRSEERGGSIIPIAGSDELAERFFSNAAWSLTQNLADTLSPRLELSDEQAAMAFLKAEWTLRSRDLAATFEAMRDVAQFMQQGFAETDRSQAMFYFVQGRAVMLASGSWELANLRDLNRDMEIGVAPMPEPDPESPRFRGLVRGPLSEARAWTDANFGVYRGTKVRTQAVDFLQYLTSRSANAAFNETAFRLPSLVGVPPSEAMRPFQPREEGHPRGFDPFFRSFGARNVVRLAKAELHHLVKPQGGVEPFIAALETRFEDAIRSDLAFSAMQSRRAAQRLDPALAAASWLAASGDPSLEAKAAQLAEAQWLRLIHLTNVSNLPSKP